MEWPLTPYTNNLERTIEGTNEQANVPYNHHGSFQRKSISFQIHPSPNPNTTMTTEFKLFAEHQCQETKNERRSNGHDTKHELIQGYMLTHRLGKYQVHASLINKIKQSQQLVRKSYPTVKCQECMCYAYLPILKWVQTSHPTRSISQPWNYRRCWMRQYP